MRFTFNFLLIVVLWVLYVCTTRTNDSNTIKEMLGGDVIYHINRYQRNHTLYKVSRYLYIISSVSSLCHRCVISVSSLCHLCVISVSSLCHLCVISVSSLCHLCVISVSSLCHLCVISVSSLCHLCVISVSSLCHLCVISVSSLSCNISGCSLQSYNSVLLVQSVCVI